ncbi:MAG TPA: hemerythrin domain-containing protein [Chitinophagaceae bacterium]|nr:hemerythrin domain-containing protein [Chitinophagaceae bacterium]
MKKSTGYTKNNTKEDRRHFIARGLKITVATGIIGTSLLTACGSEEEEKEVSPPEDLMQEHGLLNRILLIYDHCRIKLTDKESFPIEMLESAAGIVRVFVEDYHEKQEEDYLFPRFKKAHQLEGLVDTLLNQHQAGRWLTDQIMQLSKSTSASEGERQQLLQALTSFNYMYRPHEAREDTVLFPAFRKIVSQNEYDSLGEEFEKNEHKRFGKDGFDTMVDKVAGIEKVLDIYELSQFTPPTATS